MIQAVAPSTASPTKKGGKWTLVFLMSISIFSGANWTLNEEELRQKAAKIAMGKKIKEEKKKVHGADAPSDILKVHKSDEHHFAVAITEDEIVTELEALRQRLKPKADNIYNEEPF
uniref:Uncharacterized protein n=1 Tax=Ditylenchus dipsaci TaxID=166011 RepID=A0A915D5L1_9BILA